MGVIIKVNVTRYTYVTTTKSRRIYLFEHVILGPVPVLLARKKEKENKAGSDNDVVQRCSS